MKRVVVMLDGTWNTPNDHTNVYRLEQAIAPQDSAGVPPRVSYHEGVWLQTKAVKVGSAMQSVYEVVPDDLKAPVHDSFASFMFGLYRLIKLNQRFIRSYGMTVGEAIDASVQPRARLGLTRRTSRRCWQASRVGWGRRMGIGRDWREQDQSGRLSSGMWRKGARLGTSTALYVRREVRRIIYARRAM